MPFKKRFSRRGGGKLKAQVFRNKAKLRRLESSIERKHTDLTFTNVEVNTTGVVHQITDIDIGATPTDITRVGDQIACKTIMIRGAVQNSHGTAVDNFVRILVWKNKAPLGVTEVIANNVLESVSVVSMQDWSHKQNINVLFDQMFVMDTALHTNIPFKIRLSNLKGQTRYEGSGAGQADAMNNHYYIGLFSTVAGTTNDPLAFFNTRVTYDDM